MYESQMNSKPASTIKRHSIQRKTTTSLIEHPATVKSLKTVTPAQMMNMQRALGNQQVQQQMKHEDPIVANTPLPVQRVEEGAPEEQIDEQEMAMMLEEMEESEEPEPAQRVVQRAETSNQTGMPDQLKHGIEQLAGMDMSDVRVHYNSSAPATVDALAYAQGTDIHIGPGQEEHLPHEAWHVVQQKQGRVQPTMQLEGIAINDDAGLEKEATEYGYQARKRASLYPMQMKLKYKSHDAVVTQRMLRFTVGKMSNSFTNYSSLSRSFFNRNNFNILTKRSYSTKKNRSRVNNKIEANKSFNSPEFHHNHEEHKHIYSKECTVQELKKLTKNGRPSLFLNKGHYEVEQLEKEAIDKGIKVNDHYYYEFGYVIGASNGKEATCIRVDITFSGDNKYSVHSHPITKEEMNQKI